MPDSDYLVDTVHEHWDDILYAYENFADKKPIVLFDIQEHRIYVYPYKDFRASLSARSQASLKAQYEESLKDRSIVVFVRDNEERKLVSFSIPRE